MKIKNLDIREKAGKVLSNPKKFILKRALPIAIVGTMVGVPIVSHFRTSSSDGVSDGYTHVRPYIEMHIDSDDYVILNVGSSSDLIAKREATQLKLKYCKGKGINKGIVISTKADTQSEIYKEVVYVKELITEYGVELPVYLDIDNIIENGDLDNVTKENLIMTFLNKCTANKIYVGVTGNDDNLKLMRDNLDVTEFDSLVKQDGDSISYDGSYNLYIKDGRVYYDNEAVDLAKIIKEKGLNKPEGFVNDGTYTYHDGDDLNELAVTTGLSINDIFDYNGVRYNSLFSANHDKSLIDIFKPSLVDGMVLNIPTVNGKKTFSTGQAQQEYDYLEQYIRGADISSYNTVDDWSKMAEDFDYLILKAGEGGTKDVKFDEFAIEATKNNIPIGLYVVNTADSTMDQESIKKQVLKETSLAIEQASSKNIDYPIYIDLEQARVQNTSDEDLKVILETWYSKISEAGYIPGIYTSGGVDTKIHDAIGDELYSKYSLWYAYGNKYSTETDVSEVVPDQGNGLHAWDRMDVVMQQACQYSTGSAGGDGAGHIDVDFSKIDYSNPKVADSNGEEIANGVITNPMSANDVNLISLIALAGGAFGVRKIKNILKIDKLIFYMLYVKAYYIHAFFNV